MKIIHFIPKFTITQNFTVIGGAANSLYNLSKQQLKNNEINIVSFFPLGVQENIEELNNIKFIPLKMVSKQNSKLFGFEFIIRSIFFSYKHRKKYNIFHGHSGHIDYLIPFTLISKILSTPFIYSLSCPIVDDSEVTRFPGRMSLLKFLSKYVDEFIAISINVADSLSKINVRENKITIIPPAIDIEKYSFIRDKNKYRKLFNLRDDDPVFLFVGSIAPTKNLETVIKAFSHVNNKYPNAKLVITTELNLLKFSSRAAYIKSIIKEFYLDKSIIEIGIIDNMNELMGSADVLVAPFRSTDGPSDYFLPVLECLSIGRPVVVSPVGGMKEVINEKVGILVSPENAQELADAMIKLIINNDDNKRGLEGNKIIREKFNPVNINLLVNQVYLEFMNNE